MNIINRSGKYYVHITKKNNDNGETVFMREYFSMSYLKDGYYTREKIYKEISDVLATNELNDVEKADVLFVFSVALKLLQYNDDFEMEDPDAEVFIEC